MTQALKLNAPPPEVDAALAAYTPAQRRRLLQLRKLVIKTARQLDIGELIETTKWSEPAYLPKRPRTGTTIRLGCKKGDSDHYRLYVNCQTTLIQTFKTLFAEFDYEGNRGVIFPVDQAPPADAVGVMVEAALTYHKNKRAAAARA